MERAHLFERVALQHRLASGTSGRRRLLPNSTCENFSAAIGPGWLRLIESLRTMSALMRASSASGKQRVARDVGHERHAVGGRFGEDVGADGGLVHADGDVERAAHHGHLARDLLRGARGRALLHHLAGDDRRARLRSSPSSTLPVCVTSRIVDLRNVAVRHEADLQSVRQVETPDSGMAKLRGVPGAGGVLFLLCLQRTSGGERERG